MKDVSNIAVSRAVMKRQKQEAAFLKNNKGAIVWSVSRGIAPTAVLGVENANETTKTLLRAKVLASKSLAENTNIAKQMGKIEELEKSMTLLDKMRKIIGEENYIAQVTTMFHAFPVYSTFDACVDIIDVDADDGGHLPSTAFGDLLTPSAARVDIASTNEEADDVASVEEFTDEEWAANVKRSIEKGVVFVKMMTSTSTLTLLDRSSTRTYRI